MSRTVLTAVLALAIAWPATAQEDASPPAAAAAAPGTAAAAEESAPEEETERITVEGRRGGPTLHKFVLDFVTEIGDPPTPTNGYARYNETVCVGVENLQEEGAQYIVDRISAVALEVGLPIGRPGCRPNIDIVFTVDGRLLASRLVEERPRVFRPYGGVGGTNQGLEALSEFATSDAPVRWWQVTMVVDDMGNVALDLPGSIFGTPTIRGANSHITNSVQDELWATYIIVDASKLNGASFEQVADYLAMVSLAQVDPHARPSGYQTILNLFNANSPSGGMTEWDMSYLHALYQIDRRRYPRLQRGELVSIMARNQTGAAVDDGD